MMIISKQSVELVVILSNYNVVEYLGISSIKSFLLKHNIQADTSAIYLNEINKLVNKIRRNHVKIVGFTVFSNIINDVLKAAEIIKKEFKHIHICLGGPHVNTYGFHILNDNCFVDSVIEGEGELTFLELSQAIFEGKDLRGILGISYKIDGHIYTNQKRMPIANLDEIPFPDRSIFEKHKQDFMYISGGRGCMGYCTFCSEPSNNINKNKLRVRNRSAVNIVDEIEYLQNKYEISTFYFTESTFEDPGETGRKKAEGVFKEIIRRELKLSLQIYSRAELISNENMEYLELGRKAGLDCVYLGIEAGNSLDLRLYNKKATIDDNYRAISILEEIGIHVICGFICFNPYSNLDTLLQNAKFLYRSGMGRHLFLYMTRLEILPQSSIARKMKKDNLISQSFDYRGNGYDYRFQNNCVQELLQLLLTKLNSAQFDIDNKIGMYEQWINKNYSSQYSEFILLFDRMNIIRQKRLEDNNRFFTTIVTMMKHGEPMERISQYCLEFNLSTYDKEAINILLVIKKSMVKMKMT